MSANWGTTQALYKKQVDNLQINNNKKNIFKRRINNAFNTNVMKNIVKEAKKEAKALQNLRKKYKKEVNKIKNLSNNQKATARNNINALVNEEAMRKFVSNLTIKSTLNEARVSSTFSVTDIGKKILDKIFRDEILVPTLVIGLGIPAYQRFLGFTKIGNYKNPSVNINNKTLAALKRYEIYFNKGEFVRNVVFYATVIYLIRAAFLLLEHKTGEAKKIINKIMNAKIANYTVGGVSYFILRQTAIKFVMASFTAYLYGHAFMLKERSITTKPTNKLNSRLFSKALNLFYTRWLSDKITVYTDEQIKTIIKYFSYLIQGTTLTSSGLISGGGPYEVTRNVISATSGVASRVASTGSAIKGMMSPGSVSQRQRTSPNILVLTNNRNKTYTFTNTNDIKKILKQKYTNGSARGSNDIILKSNNNTKYRVTKEQYNKATMHEPGLNSPTR